MLFYAHCPWDMTPFIFIIGLCWALVTIAKEPVIILCFVLVSKGCAPCNPMMRGCNPMTRDSSPNALWGCNSLSLSLSMTRGGPRPPYMLSAAALCVPHIRGCQVGYHT